MNFIYNENDCGCLDCLMDPLDKEHMNWVSNPDTWGKIKCFDGIHITLNRFINAEGNLVEKYVFKNISGKELFFNDGDISVAISLPDKYETAGECFDHCCHVHLWCGYDVSYICALRMSGASNKRNLGMYVKNGGLSGYGIERKKEALSNDRGTFLLYPCINNLPSNKEYVLTMEWFWFDNITEFGEIIYSKDNYINVSFENYICFLGNEVKPQISYKEEIDDKEIKIFCNGKICKSEKNLGQCTWDFYYNQIHTIARTLILPKPMDLFEKRCKFIVDHQQVKCEGSHFNGALISYDNDTNKTVYRTEYDYNAGRERVGMGALLALYLQKNSDEQVERCLNSYTQFVKRELFDTDSGVVFNDVERNNEWNRLYNYPWMAIFFMERFNLYHNKEDALYMYRALKSYYIQDGKKFYGIGIPMLEAIETLKEALLLEEAEILKKLFLEHAYEIAKTGLNYPKSEVNYEQSIVAPAVCYLLQGYKISGDELLLREAQKQLKVLELFNGFAPDYHLNEVAIRHWDGYWFGKKRQLGDTFPHYWSCLTALAFLFNGKITKNKTYLIRAEKAARAVLALFNEKGEGSCAYIYPKHINGAFGEYFDPLANDQDWGMYYYMKYFYED